MRKIYFGLVFIIIILITGFMLLCHLPNNNLVDDQNHFLPTRESQIPADVTKITPETDPNSPKSMSDEYYNPVPVGCYVNTAGAEDSAFVIADGSVLYFFFVPDVRLPVEEQVLDPTVGIYLSKNINGVWSEPIRVVLQDEGKLAMDGCEFVQDDIMYFCSAREGYTGLHWFKAQFVDGMWQNWENADSFLKTEEFETGELHISSDGNELWFSKSYSVWRSKRIGGEWQEPELMFSPLCGEPSVDEFGNVYFTHHFFDCDVMVEADIYVAVKK